MAAIYAHPVEFIFSNVFPLLSGVLLAKSHLLTSWLWFALALYSTIHHHGGYAFPWLLGTLEPSDHDWHHAKFDVHYGLLGWLDALHGTNKIAGMTRQQTEQVLKKNSSCSARKQNGQEAAATPTTAANDTKLE
jgi:methylsterol monooxygenase